MKILNFLVLLVIMTQTMSMSLDPLNIEKRRRIYRPCIWKICSKPLPGNQNILQNGKVKNFKTHEIKFMCSIIDCGKILRSYKLSHDGRYFDDVMRNRIKFHF